MPVWLRLSVAGGATLFVGMGLGRFSYTALIPAIIEDGGLGATEAGSVGAFNLAGFLVGALAAPKLRARWGEATALRGSLILALICLTASILPWGFVWLAFWRFLVGGAVAVMMIYALAIVTRHAPPQKLGAATGVVFTGVGIAILLTGTLVPLLLDVSLAATWAGLAFIGALGVTIAFWGWAVAGDGKGNASGPDMNPRPRVRWTPVVIGLAAARTAFTLGLIPHSIYWVDYLVRGLGNDIQFGGMHWVLFGLGAVSGTYLWGRLADRIGFRSGMVLAFAVLAAGVAFPVVHSVGWALVLSSLVVGAQPGFSAIIAGRTHQLVGPEMMADVWRAATLVSGIAQAVGGYFFVALFAWTESYVPIFLAGGAAMAFGAVLSVFLRPGAAAD